MPVFSAAFRVVTFLVIKGCNPGTCQVYKVWVGADHDESCTYRGAAGWPETLHGDEAVNDMEVGFNSLSNAHNIMGKVFPYMDLSLIFLSHEAPHHVFQAHTHTGCEMGLYLWHVDKKSVSRHSLQSLP